MVPNVVEGVWLTLLAVVGTVEQGEDVDDLAAKGADAIETDLPTAAAAAPSVGRSGSGDAAAGAHEVESGGSFTSALVAGADGIAGGHFSFSFQEETQVVAAVLAAAAHLPRPRRLVLCPSGPTALPDGTHTRARARMRKRKTERYK